MPSTSHSSMNRGPTSDGSEVHSTGRKPTVLFAEMDWTEPSMTASLPHTSFPSHRTRPSISTPESVMRVLLFQYRPAPSSGHTPTRCMPSKELSRTTVPTRPPTVVLSLQGGSAPSHEPYSTPASFRSTTSPSLNQLRWLRSP